MITQDRLVEVLDYSQSTGVFTWKVKPARNIAIGSIAGHRISSGYRYISIDRAIYLAHRLAWLYVHGVWPDQIDHVNHIRGDNRFTNLRSVSPSGNSKNRSVQSNNKSGVSGVRWYRSSTWEARIFLGRKCIGLGYFKDKFDAICARKSAENRLGFHPNHGKRQEHNNAGGE